ncbi:MAG: DUF2087 domain-containing protein [Nitriliruptoraceae bacterium]|nr:DUF2087 domain-containing protein [Nitriliruptoraceae bacterium]
MDPLTLLRALLDPARLAVVGALARAPATSAELAAEAGQERDEVLRMLAPFVQSGLLTRDPQGRYGLEPAAWQRVADQLPRDAPPSPRIAFGLTADEADLIAPFFVGDRLVELPAARAKRAVVLERLALEFEPGVRYDEREVNDILRRFHDDYTTLRRALIDAGLLDRAAGEYWRAGGRIG